VLRQKWSRGKENLSGEIRAAEAAQFARESAMRAGQAGGLEGVARVTDGYAARIELRRPAKHFLAVSVVSVCMR
jgi:hypothetical protein